MGCWFLDGLREVAWGCAWGLFGLVSAVRGEELEEEGEEDVNR